MTDAHAEAVKRARERWIEVDRHPLGFEIAMCLDHKPPWTGIRIGHPDWVKHRKVHRYVWMLWHRGRKQLIPSSNSPITQEFEWKHPEVHAWVTWLLRHREL